MDKLQFYSQTKTSAAIVGKKNLLLSPFQRKRLEKSLQQDLSRLYRQRIEIMLLADEGKTQTQICQTLRCSLGTARHWILMAKSGQSNAWQNSPIGRPKVVNNQYLERLKALSQRSPQEFGYAFRKWTGYWLSKHLATELGIEISPRRINQLLREIALPTPKENNFKQEKNDSVKIHDLPSIIVASQSSELWLFDPVQIS